MKPVSRISYALSHTQEIKPLTSIRGIAAVLVVIYHYHAFDAIPYAPLLAFVRKGYLCVDLFFVLSGFIMAMTYGSLFLKPYSWGNHEEFLLRRLGRVYPLYIVITLGVSLYSLAIYGGYDHVHKPAVHLNHPIITHITNILMIQAWGFGEHIVGPAWSISAEWLVYIFFPLVVWWGLSQSRILAITLLLIACASLLHVAFNVETDQAIRQGQMDVWHGADSLLVLRCFGGFSLGLLTFRLRETAFAQGIYADCSCAAIVIGLIFLMARAEPDLVIYPLLPLLILSLYGNRGRAATLFSGAIVYRLGVLSYSIYLVHDHFLVVLQQLQKRLPLPALYANSISAVVTYSLVLIISSLTYRFIENPGRAWFKRFARKTHEEQSGQTTEGL